MLKHFQKIWYKRKRTSETVKINIKPHFAVSTSSSVHWTQLPLFVLLRADTTCPRPLRGALLGHRALLVHDAEQEVNERNISCRLFVFVVKMTKETTIKMLKKMFFCCVTLGTNSRFSSRHRRPSRHGRTQPRHCPHPPPPLSWRRRESASQLAAAVNSATVPQTAHGSSFVVEEVASDGFWSEPVWPPRSFTTLSVIHATIRG